MLSPHDRTLLLEALRPPADRRLDWALFTTYSMDLTALLSVPLAFAGYERSGSDEVPDPMVLLAALRRIAGRLTVFCQAGEMLVPRRRPRLLHELEPCVVECLAQGHGASFHPKVALLRFEGDPICYRLLCSSRNLTLDSSWDTVVVLDGEVAGDGRGDEENEALVEFFQALPGMCVRGVPGPVQDRLKLLSREVRAVRFEPPPGFRAVRFWPAGIGGEARWPFPAGAARTLIVSPFVSDGCLERIARSGGDLVLVSRPESLDALGSTTLERFPDTRVLADAADEGSALVPDEEPPGARLRGLHAKLYVVETGDKASIFTGSANATNAAFGGNTEMLVELQGSRSRCGIDLLLSGSKGTTCFGDMLVPYRRPLQQAVDDPVARSLDERLRDARRTLVAATLEARVRRGAVPDQHVLSLAGSIGVDGLDGVIVTAWPLTLPEGSWARALAGGDGELATWPGISLAALTPFVAFEARASEMGQEAVSRFVLNVPLIGAPEDRLDRLLDMVIGTSDQFVRLVRLLLADDLGRVAFDEVAGPPEESDGESAIGRSAPGGGTELPVLETLLRTLERQPDRLDQVAALVGRLDRSPRGGALLPAGFREAWQAIWPVREEMRR